MNEVGCVSLRFELGNILALDLCGESSPESAEGHALRGRRIGLVFLALSVVGLTMLRLGGWLGLGGGSGFVGGSGFGLAGCA